MNGHIIVKTVDKRDVLKEIDQAMQKLRLAKRAVEMGDSSGAYAALEEAQHKAFDAREMLS